MVTLMTMAMMGGYSELGVTLCSDLIGNPVTFNVLGNKTVSLLPNT